MKRRKKRLNIKNKYVFFILLSLHTIAIFLMLCSLAAWLIADLFDGQSDFLFSLCIIQGIYAVILLLMLPAVFSFYRATQKEIDLLTAAIRKVAEGDFNQKIEPTKNADMRPVYEDFNKMCAELESVQILRNDFINSYSHEFKTPIASINGFASLLLEKDLSEEERKQYLEIIEAESARLSKLATNTILLSKLSSQQIVTDTEEYDISEQLRACSIILSQKWLEKKIAFNAEFVEAKFIGNKEMLQHLWLNLLDNAIKFTPIGGEIAIRNYITETEIFVEISDTGEGMDEENLKHLFDPYYQGDSSHSTQGLGLGLSIVKRIVELCGGEITVQSKLSVGSTFTVCLPLAT